MNQMTAWLLLLLAIFLGAIGQIFMKEAMKIAGPVPIHAELSVLFHYFFHAIVSVRMVGAILSYGFSFIVWLGLLSIADLSLMRPMMSIGYLVTLAYGWSAGEQVTLDRIVGTLLIIVGLFFVTKSGLK